MSEDRQVVAGEAILNGAGVERSRVESREVMLEKLVREHSRLVYRIAYSVLRRHQDAEDATQETFMRVLRYSSKLALVDDPKTWLARIAWRVAVDRSKQQLKTREVALEDPQQSKVEPASDTPGAEENLQTARIGAQLERLIAALPENLREPLILSTIEEITPQGVALTLGVSEAAVRSRVFRARQILREKLESITEKKL